MNKRNILIVLVVVLIAGAGYYLAPSSGTQGFLKSNLNKNVKPINQIVAIPQANIPVPPPNQPEEEEIEDPAAPFTGSCIPGGNNIRDRVVTFTNTERAFGEYMTYDNFYQALRSEVQNNANNNLGNKSNCPYLIDLAVGGRPRISYVCEYWALTNAHISCVNSSPADGIGVGLSLYQNREGAETSIVIRNQENISFDHIKQEFDNISVYRVAEDYVLQ